MYSGIPSGIGSVQGLQHLVDMTPGPVNFVAERAAAEEVEILNGERLQPVEDILFAYRLEEGVAFKTTAQRVRGRSVAEQLKDFPQLFHRGNRPDITAEFNLISFEQIQAAGQEQTPVPLYFPQNSSHIPGGVVEGVEAGHPEVAGKPADVDIHNKSDGRQRVGAQQGGVCDIPRARDRVDVESLVCFDPLAKVRAPAVTGNPANLGMRQPEGFDDILDGS
jgi:hypothetical protein